MNFAKSLLRKGAVGVFIFKVVCGLGVAAAALPASPAGTTAIPGSRLAIFLYGLPGNSELTGLFKFSWAALQALMKTNGFKSEELVRFSASPDSQLPTEYESTAESLSSHLKQLSSKTYDNLFIFIAGHGNGQDLNTMFHIPGRDVPYGEMIKWINSFSANRLIIVVAAPHGETWIRELKQPNRIVIAASGLKEFDFIPINFLKVFPVSFRPVTKDALPMTQISLADALVRTQLDIRKWYEKNRLHPTEIAYIDADQDGVGTTLLGPEFETSVKAELEGELTAVPVVIPAQMVGADAGPAQSVIFKIPKEDPYAQSSN